MRNCLYCNKPFEPTRSDRVYCRKKCVDRASAKRTGKHNKHKKPVWFWYKKGYCELCGFIAENLCQLDVDHIDGDKTNNNPTNYQTLCANCHRLKTFKNRDWEKKTPDP